MTEESSPEAEALAARALGAIFAIGGLAYVGSLVYWLASQISAVLAGHGWRHRRIPRVEELPSSLLHLSAGTPRGTHSAGISNGPTALTWTILTILCIPICYAAFRLVRFAMNWRRRREFRLLRLGFASGNEIRKMLGSQAVLKKAKSVRPSLRNTKIRPKDVGYYLGRDLRSQQKLYASVEDVFIILAPPRQGKDVHFCTPFTIDAPGACIVTSSRADAFTNTHAMRADMGSIYVFDPNGLTNWPERLRWSPVRGCEDPLTAANRSAALIAGSGLEISGDAAIWVSSATAILRCYLHAASLGGRTIRDIVRWSTQPTNPEPRNLLREHERNGTGAQGWAGELESMATAGTLARGAMWANVVQALGCFSDPAVLDACSPNPDERFDLKKFLAERNTLYILGKEKKNGSIAPVISAMLEDLFDETRRIASRMPSSRLEPPLTVELNEVAHIAPIPNLPGYMGDSGGFSIALHVYLQSLSQARSRWGDEAAMIMWDNAAIRIMMGGAGNVDDLEDISRLMGEIQVKSITVSEGSQGSRRSVGMESRRVLSLDEVRTLEFGKAVIVARAARPVEVKLTPWWERKDGKKIAAGKAKTEKLVLQYSEAADNARRQAVDSSARATMLAGQD